MTNLPALVVSLGAPTTPDIDMAELYQDMLDERIKNLEGSMSSFYVQQLNEGEVDTQTRASAAGAIAESILALLLLATALAFPVGKCVEESIAAHIEEREPDHTKLVRSV